MSYHLRKYEGVQLPKWIYLGGERLASPSDVALNLPSEATIIRMVVVGGTCNFSINGAVASVTSPGYIPQNDIYDIGPIGNLNSVRVFSAAGTLYVLYFREG